MAETCLKSSHPTSVSLVLLTASSLQSEQTNMLQSNGEEITRARGPIAKAALIWNPASEVLKWYVMFQTDTWKKRVISIPGFKSTKTASR